MKLLVRVADDNGMPIGNKEYYVIAPSEFEDAWNEMLTDIAKSITKKYKGEIKAIVEKAVEDKLAKLKMEEVEE